MQHRPELEDQIKSLGRTVGFMLKVIIGLVLLVMMLFGYIAYTGKGIWVLEKEPIVTEKSVVVEKSTAVQDTFWDAPEIASLDGNPAKEQILYGKDIIANTSKYFGPKGMAIEWAKWCKKPNYHFDCIENAKEHYDKINGPKELINWPKSC